MTIIDDMMHHGVLSACILAMKSFTTTSSCSSYHMIDHNTIFDVYIPLMYIASGRYIGYVWQLDLMHACGSNCD